MFFIFSILKSNSIIDDFDIISSIRILSQQITIVNIYVNRQNYNALYYKISINYLKQKYSILNYKKLLFYLFITIYTKYFILAR